MQWVATRLSNIALGWRPLELGAAQNPRAGDCVAPITPLNLLALMFLTLAGNVPSLAHVDLKAWQQRGESR